MITLNLTESQLDELYETLSSNPKASDRKKCLVVYLRAKGYPREAVADISRVDPDSVTNYVKLYIAGGESNLLQNNYRKAESQRAPHTEQLTELFKKNAAHRQPSDSAYLRTHRHTSEALELPEIFENIGPEIQVLRTGAG